MFVQLFRWAVGNLIWAGAMLSFSLATVVSLGQLKEEKIHQCHSVGSVGLFSHL